MDASSSSYLSSLNPAQLRAVEHPPTIPLQILAGPGSGKTKVLTSRIAHLILRCSVPPGSICAVTFTNKAANELRSRLHKVLGKDNVHELKIGTFHSLCAKFLRMYAHTVGLADNFSICDADEARRIIGQLLKKFADFLADRDISMKEGFITSKISKAKAKGITANQFAAGVDGKLAGSLETMPPQDIQEKIISQIYQGYEKLLQQHNALDFDDLLLYGVAMFKQRKETISWCQHVLVDEFQDTNAIQYDLMQTIAPQSCVTIVGDPDQSIYGWRSAEVANLNRMKIDFPGTEEIFLEENYRSTGAILRVSLAIIAEDKNRIQKSLHTSHPVGKTPMLRPCPTEIDEAAFIAIEIKRLVACTGGLLQFEDFAILLRSNALSRVIESSLQKEGIPCRILGGHRFFERSEVKDLIAYLQLIDNPNFYPAFSRAVNTPSRGVGEKTLLEIALKAEQYRTSHLAVLERIFDGNIPDIKPPVRRKISPFVSTIRALRDLSQKGTSSADVLHQLIRTIDYMEYLKKTHIDWESRWSNVEELINFATDIGTDTHAETSSDTPLRLFLQASSLSSEGDNDGKIISKVTIATCHAAKGLEWPVVIIPSVEEGTFPFSRCDDVEEERRLLYVACTRAKYLLYLTHTHRRKVAGQQKDVDRSSFVDNVFHKYPDILTHQHPEFDADDRIILSDILRRQAPNEEEVARRLAEFDEMIRCRKGAVNIPEQTEQSESNGSDWKYKMTEPPIPAFRTANRMMSRHSLQPQHRNVVGSVLGGQSMNVMTAPTYRTSDEQFADQDPQHIGDGLAARTPGNGSLFPTLQELLPTREVENSCPILAVSNSPALPITNQAIPAQQIVLSHRSASTSQPNDMGQQETQGGKRRLGMGRVSSGYANKKFKLPC